MNSHVRKPVGSEFDLDLSGTFIRRTSLRNASLQRADFTNADCSYVDFRGADFKDTILDGTILRGADLTDAVNLTADQIAKAIIDRDTKLPSYLKLPEPA